MTLKNSFWANLKENNKRRLWVWVISALVFLLGEPLGISMEIAQFKARAMQADLYEKVRLEKELGEMLLGFFKADNIALWILVSAAAVLCALQGYSYLYQRTKIDFYLSMPVKKRERFFFIWLNGIAIYLLPMLAGTLITAALISANGLMSAELIKTLLISVCLLLLLFLCIYHLSILAVMLTGTVIATCLGIAVFLSYEIIVRLLLEDMGEMFFYSYAFNESRTTAYFSPYYMLDRAADKIGHAASFPWMAILGLCLFALAIGAAAYLAYQKRPLELAGKAVVFPALEVLIKFLITVPAAILAGGFTAGIVDYNPVWRSSENAGFMVAAIILGAVICSCFIQVIYETDIKAVLHTKGQTLLAVLLSLFVFAIFRYDLIGYDRYIPKAEAVESAALVLPADNFFFNSTYLSKDLSYIGKDQYVKDVICCEL